MHIRLITLEKRLCALGMAVAGVLLVALMLMSGANVAFRVAGRALNGTFELSGYFAAVMIALALAETQRRRGHVEIDIFTRLYSARTKRWLGAVNVLASAALVLLLATQIAFRASVLLKSGEVSETLKLPYAYLMFGVSFGLYMLTASFLTDFILIAFGFGNLGADAKDKLKVRRDGTVNSIRGEIG
ncbi:MAG: TRAP transporter small permease [Kiritimatiellaeota bacterium]|nr:TRAP transporter small permease [Kiritimatiellota bacterium]